MRIASIRSIRRWPVPIRRAVLCVAFLAISFYINSEILDVDGSRFTTPLIAVWTDFEITDNQTEQLVQAAVPPSALLTAEWDICSTWTDSRPGLPIQPRSRRIVSGASRTPGATRITSPSADPV